MYIECKRKLVKVHLTYHTVEPWLCWERCRCPHSKFYGPWMRDSMVCGSLVHRMSALEMSNIIKYRMGQLLWHLSHDSREMWIVWYVTYHWYRMWFVWPFTFESLIGMTSRLKVSSWILCRLLSSLRSGGDRGKFEVLSGCYIKAEMTSSLRNDMTSSSSKCVKSRGHSPEVKFNPNTIWTRLIVFWGHLGSHLPYFHVFRGHIGKRNGGHVMTWIMMHHYES